MAQYKNIPKSELESSIEFKLHNDFFRHLNEWLDETAKFGRDVYKNRNLLQDFFRNVNMLRVRYGKEFLTDNVKLKIQLLSVKKRLFSPQYAMLLNVINQKGFKRLSGEDQEYFVTIHNECLQVLEDVFESINGQLSEGELLPKVIKTKKQKDQRDHLKGVGL